VARYTVRGSPQTTAKGEPKMSDTSIEKGVEDRPDLAKILYDLRQHLTLTQSQMAEQLGISQAMVSAIEKGRTEPSSKLADKILNYSKTLEEREAKASESDFGEWLREQRAKHNLTQAELAEKAGISLLTISFIETGKTQSPQKATISAIEKALGRGLPTEVKTEISEETEVGGLGEYFGPFPLEDWEANVGNGTPGIYVFYDILKRPVYVGQTSDLKTRIRQYEDFFWFKSPIVDSFAFIVVRDDKLRRQVEAAMIKLVGENAIFNKQHKIT